MAVLVIPEKNKKMKEFFYIAIIIIAFLSSCSSTRKIQTPVVIVDNTDTVSIVPVKDAKEDSLIFIKENYTRIIDNKIKFTTFSAKIDLDIIDGEGKNNNANAHIRMYRDSIIWVSLTGPLGIEGLRAFITRDSVKLLDKQKKVYTVRSVSYLQEMTELPLELSSLQDLLLGNPVFLDSNIKSYNKAAENISFESIGDFFKNIFTIKATDKVVQNSLLNDIDETKTRTCKLTYDDYETKKGLNFSTKRSIDVSDKKNFNIKMEFKQYDFNETLSFPFPIPKRYDRN
jgi:hypothetical protein